MDYTLKMMPQNYISLDSSIYVSHIEGHKS